MSTILSIHSVKAFKEYLLPAINNAEYSIIISKDIFRLDHDVELHMEVINKVWSFLQTEEYELKTTETDTVCFGIPLKDKDLLTLTLFDNEHLSLMIRETDSSFEVFEKYDIRNGQEITIGQSERNIIRYDILNLVSRNHAVIRKNANRYIIEDKSANGVFVNSIRIVGSRQLEFGDSINIFGLCLVFLDGIIAVNAQKENVFVDRQKLSTYQAVDADDTKAEKGSQSQKSIVFHRSPRQLAKLADDTVEIEAPPQPKSINRKPLGMLIGPSMTMALPMLLGCGLAIYSTRVSGNSSSAFMYTGLITAVSSALIGTVWAILNLRFENKKNREEELHRFEAYGEYLIKCSNTIKEKYEHNRAGLNSMYLSAEECCSYSERTAVLWNRNTNHDDFLSHRLGMGDMPFQVKITIPKERFTLINDSLSEKPKMIEESYRTLHGVPICVDMVTHRLIGVIGGEKKHGAIEVLHNLVAQIAASNCYTDVKMAFIYDEGDDENNRWGYMKWFPHVWSEDKKTRFIARNKAEAGDVFYEITKALRIRSENRTSYNKRDTLVKPQYVLFIADPEFLEGELISTYIFDKKEDCGLTTVFLVDNYEKLPNACDFIIQNDAEFRGMYGVKDDVDERVRINFDRISDSQLEQLARTLSNIEVHESEAGGDIPSALSFFDMYKINRLEELNVEERWRKNRTYESMKALIGEKAGGAPWYLDIHEKYHGPHGLIAGTTGSGKSETLQTYMLSLAINFSPDDIGFFIIDYKGGGMANLFDGLPHIIGQISNLSGNQVKRAMVSIKSENRRRQRIFNEYGVNNINLYTRLYKNNEAVVPVPHMFIIIDEFAELKREEPDFMRELISVAQVGRSLGVHLILATQKPSGTVDDNIWSNSKFRLCLRVQDRQDSNDMLHRPDAAYITQAGRCYMQVGNDELFELFQSGYSGAVWDEENDNVKEEIAKMVSSTGRAALVGNRSKIKRKEFVKKNWILQLLNIIEKVKGETEIADILPDTVRTEELIKRIFVELENQEIEYAYSEYNARRVKDLLRAYVGVKAQETGASLETAEKVLIYISKNKALKLPEKKEKTQLDAVVNYLGIMAKRNGYTHNLQLWLPVLPTALYLRELTGFESFFGEKGWRGQTGEWNIEVPVGMFDDPVNQAQGTVSVNFSLNGHHALIGTVVSGKSTFLQTLVYSLVHKYTPADINIYAIDFSAKMLSAFEKMPHVGGVIYENENEKLAKFFNMLGVILEERKQLFRGGNYSQYVRVNGVIIPAIILIIDNYANFRNKTNNIYEDMILQLSKDAVNYGIFLVITAGGFNSLEIPNRIGDNLRTVICLEMGDKYQYTEALRTMHIDTLPEVNVKGRGLVHVGEQILEFQTALAFEADDDFSRMERIQSLALEMSKRWDGKCAERIPEIPEKPVWEEFVALSETGKQLSDDRHLPIGYNFKNASVYGIDLSRSYCYLISGRTRSGKTNLLKVIMQGARLKGGKITIFDFKSDFTYLSGQSEIELIDDDKKMFQMFSDLVPEFKRRNEYKKSMMQGGVSDEELYLNMKQFAAKYLLIGDLADFITHATHPKDAGEMKPFIENLFERGSFHNVFWFASYNQEDVSRVAGNKLYDLFIKYKSGIHFGGNVASQRILNFDYVPYAEQTKALKPGVAMLPFNEEEDVHKVIVPLMKG